MDAIFESVLSKHYFSFVKADLERYLPKVKRDGLITGDDYHWTSPELNGQLDVKRAVEEFCATHQDVEFVELIGDQFVLRRL